MVLADLRQQKKFTYKLNFLQMLDNFMCIEFIFSHVLLINYYNNVIDIIYYIILNIEMKSKKQLKMKGNYEEF